MLRARSRGSARRRLALLYGGLFLVMGTIVIAIIYAVASVRSTVHAVVASPQGPVRTVVDPGAIGQLQHNADLARLLTASWLVLAVTAVAATVLGWFAAGRVLRPLREMDATARTISAGNLGQRLELTGPDDEFRRLGDTLDDLLARLEAAFEAQRRFVANASHELRTPLTVDRTLLQVALADPNASAEKLRATCQELLASGREQERLLEALLTLASSERGLDRREPLDLALLAGRVAADRSATLATSLNPAPTTGDRALVDRLIANLIDNAIEYNDERCLVEVTTGADALAAYIVVVSTGPAIHPLDIERMFEPFQRLGDRRTATAGGHHGLGLSIVRAIAHAHGAVVDAQPRAGGGLAVTVSFPR
jgi:signal transduction histidine kinase